MSTQSATNLRKRPELAESRPPGSRRSSQKRRFRARLPKAFEKTVNGHITPSQGAMRFPSRPSIPTSVKEMLNPDIAVVWPDAEMLFRAPRRSVNRLEAATVSSSNGTSAFPSEQ